MSNKLFLRKLTKLVIVWSPLKMKIRYQRIIEHYWVHISITEHYWELLSFSIAEHCWALLIITELCWEFWTKRHLTNFSSKILLLKGKVRVFSRVDVANERSTILRFHHPSWMSRESCLNPQIRADGHNKWEFHAENSSFSSCCTTFAKEKNPLFFARIF